ncbi:MAG: hypothetical protein K0R89_3597 [Ramlibacter sp.]|jgi:hypothetical protein|nr:hypothetical protein [Ramlibacter sp.]MCD6079653.1 hypothetical protein [Ramlibacter sp.]
MRTPQGITPPAPGLDREEPEFRREADIPDDDAHLRGRAQGNASQEERPHKPERE